MLGLATGCPRRAKMPELSLKDIERDIHAVKQISYAMQLMYPPHWCGPDVCVSKLRAIYQRAMAEFRRELKRDPKAADKLLYLHPMQLGANLLTGMIGCFKSRLRTCLTPDHPKMVALKVRFTGPRSWDVTVRGKKQLPTFTKCVRRELAQIKVPLDLQGLTVTRDFTLVAPCPKCSRRPRINIGGCDVPPRTPPRR